MRRDGAEAGPPCDPRPERAAPGKRPPASPGGRHEAPTRQPFFLGNRRDIAAECAGLGLEAEQSQPVKRAYNTARLPKAKHGVIRTKRHSFEITPELHKEMLQTLAEYTAKTGDKISASEFIRKAIAREIREFKR